MIILYHHYYYCSLDKQLNPSNCSQLVEDTWMTCQGEHAAADDQETQALSPLPDFGGKRGGHHTGKAQLLSNPTP